MTETTEAPVAASPSPKGKKAAAKKVGKKAGSTPSHPPISQMVTAAVRELKEKGGSSTQAIKKYIGANYKIDVEKKSKFIAKYLKAAVVAGSLVQTKGKGASGSFKLAGSGDAKPKKQVTKRAAKTAVKKTTPKKKPVAKTTKPETKKAAPSKAKKAKKPPTTPKPPKAKAVSKVKKTPAKAKSPAKRKTAAAKKKASPKKK